jgi:small neutral amino acid transporter SnatA (MarC family)
VTSASGEVVKSALLLLVILNPFALSVYLMEIFQSQTLSTVAGVLTRAVLISGVVFVLFAWGGDRIFDDVLQVRFAAFQIFGGVVFLIIGVRFMISGGEALVVLRGRPEHLVGTIAMPFMIGPGTVSAAIVAGARLPLAYATLSIGGALAATLLMLLGVKLLFDRLRSRNGRLVERYADIAGRVAAVLIGTIAVEMVLDGIQGWLHSIGKA